MENILKGKTKYTVYSNQADAQGEMSLSQIVMMLIDSASRHAETGGFGFQDLIKENHRWVLARLAVEMNRYPKVDEDIAVET